MSTIKLRSGRTSVVWSAATDLCGAIQWDAIDAASVDETLAIVELLDRSGCAVVIDWRAVTRVDTDALLAVTQRVHARATTPVLLVPPGIAGILLAGLAQAFAPTAPPIAADHEAAVAALAHPRAADALAAASDRAFEVRASSADLVRVRDELRHDLSATLADCAVRLGWSTRTLQRTLEARGTTFTAELRRARVVAATEMLAYTDTKIDAIAARTGFGSSSRLSAMLRRELHATAGELRARYHAAVHP